MESRCGKRDKCRDRERGSWSRKGKGWGQGGMGTQGQGLTASELPESSRSLTVRAQAAGGGAAGRSWLSSRKKPGCHMSGRGYGRGCQQPVSPGCPQGRTCTSQSPRPPVLPRSSPSSSPNFLTIPRTPELPQPAQVPNVPTPPGPFPSLPTWLTQINRDVRVRGPGPPRDGQSVAGGAVGVQGVPGTPLAAAGGAVELVGRGVLRHPAVAGGRGPAGRARC